MLRSKEYYQDYYSRNKDRLRLYQKEYRKKNLNKIRQEAKNWASRNREHCRKYYKEHREEILIERKLDRKLHPEKYAIYERKRNRSNSQKKRWVKAAYNMSVEDYDKLYQKLLDEQQGCCAICGRHHSRFKKRLSLDHNHKTDKIRGLLCWRCNYKILSSWADDIDISKNVIKYLSKNSVN